MKNEHKPRFSVEDKVEFIEEIGPRKGYSFIIDKCAKGTVKEIWPFVEGEGCCGLTVEVCDIYNNRRLAVVAEKYVRRYCSNLNKLGEVK